MHYPEGADRLAEDTTMVLREADADVRAYIAGLPPLEKVTAVCTACGELIRVRAGHEAEDTAFQSRVCPHQGTG